MIILFIDHLKKFTDFTITDTQHVILLHNTNTIQIVQFLEITGSALVQRKYSIMAVSDRPVIYDYMVALTLLQTYCEPVLCRQGDAYVIVCSYCLCSEKTDSLRNLQLLYQVSVDEIVFLQMECAVSLQQQLYFLFISYLSLQFGSHSFGTRCALSLSV